MLNFSSWGFIILSALCDSFAAFIVKSRFNELGKINYGSIGSIISYLSNFVRSPILLLAVISFVIAPVLWFFALNRVEVSVGYPALVVFHLIFITFFALVFLGEALTFPKIIGMLLIVGAIICLKVI